MLIVACQPSSHDHSQQRQTARDRRVARASGVLSAWVRGSVWDGLWRRHAGSFPCGGGRQCTLPEQRMRRRRWLGSQLPGMVTAREVAAARPRLRARGGARLGGWYNDWGREGAGLGRIRLLSRLWDGALCLVLRLVLVAEDERYLSRIGRRTGPAGRQREDRQGWVARVEAWSCGRTVTRGSQAIAALRGDIAGPPSHVRRSTERDTTLLSD